MKRLVSLLREFCYFNSGPLRVLICISPGIVWKFMYPDAYYSTGWSGYADFCIFVLIQVALILMFWEFIKHKLKQSQEC